MAMPPAGCQPSNPRSVTRGHRPITIIITVIIIIIIIIITIIIIIILIILVRIL